MRKTDLMFIAGAWVLSMVAIGFMAKLGWSLIQIGWGVLP